MTSYLGALPKELTALVNLPRAVLCAFPTSSHGDPEKDAALDQRGVGRETSDGLPGSARDGTMPLGAGSFPRNGSHHSNTTKGALLGLRRCPHHRYIPGLLGLGWGRPLPQLAACLPLPHSPAPFIFHPSIPPPRPPPACPPAKLLLGSKSQGGQSIPTAKGEPGPRTEASPGCRAEPGPELSWPGCSGFLHKRYHLQRDLRRRELAKAGLRDGRGRKRQPSGQCAQRPRG